MNIVERVRGWARNFVLGPAVVDPFEKSYGHQPELPIQDYGPYLMRSPIYTCATIRANMIKGLPFEAFRNIQNNKTLVERGALYELLHKVNPFWTFRKLLEYTELSRCIWGEAYWFLERGTSGRLPPREIWWARADQVRLVTDEIGYIAGYLYFPVVGGQPIEFSPGEVIRFPLANILDEFSALPPVAPLRMASDLGHDAMGANRNLFRHGMMGGGMVLPPKGATLTRDQAAELENKIEHRASGVDRSHRWTVMRYEFQMQPNAITPHDAEFLGTLNYSLEEAARVYGVPLDMIGGQRTYENVQAAERAIWNNTLKPEADDLADTITEFLVPMFTGEADEVRVNYDDIDALHESEDAKWERERGQLETGAITINEWREERGLESVVWGDGPLWEAKSQGTEKDPVEIATEEQELQATSNPLQGVETAGNDIEGDQERAMSQERWAFGGEMHRIVWTRFARRLSEREERLQQVVQELFRRQMDSVKARVKNELRGEETNRQPLPRLERGLADEPFNMAEWIKKFREAMRVQLRQIVDESGSEAMDDLKIQKKFQVNEPQVRQYIETRAQRFAVQVNETTWDLLRKSIGEGIDAGEGLTSIMERVETVMGDRINSSAEIIARTEVGGAMNGGTRLAWMQSGVVTGKRWIAELDARVRDSHAEAHGQVVGLDEDFEVGDASGPGPGEMGAPEEDINCRCTMAGEIEEEE